MSYGTARCNANGVVVNRNFDIEWEEGTDDPSSLMYRGPAPESEPEMRLLLGVVSDPRVTHVIDAHAHGQTDALWWYGAATRAVLHESHQLTHPYVAAQPSVVKRRLNEMSYLELLKSLILSGN